MRYILFAFLACVSLATAQTARAQQAADPITNRYSVQGIRMKCEAANAVTTLDRNDPDFGIKMGWAQNCFGFFNGVLSTYHDLGLMTGRPFVCPPTNGTIGQYVAVFLKWTDAHPDQWDTSGSSGVYMALEEAFPCRPK